MSGPAAQADEEVEDASPPRKRIKTEQQNQETVILSIETLEEGSIETCVPDIENPTSRICARRTSSPSSGLGDTGSLPVALPSPSLHRAAVTLHGLLSANGRAVDTSDLCTRQPSLGASITSALSDDRQLSVNFASAPSDPEELAHWVAECIKLCVSEEVGSEPAEAGKRRRSQSHAPGAKLREKNDKDRTLEELATLEKIRELGRMRKANWRKGQTEANKNNDLRCRVAKRAKAIFGAGLFSEKSEWMTNEFAKRKEKRKFKERRNCESRFTGFDLPLDLGAKLFNGGNDEVDGEEVNAAGILLVNTLHIVTSLEGLPSNADAAYALKAALNDPEIGTQPFVKALGILSKDLSIVSAIVAPSGPSSKASSKASSRAPSKVSPRAPSNPPTSRPSTAMSVESNYSSRASSIVARAKPHGARLTSGIQGSSSPAAHRFQLRGGIFLETNVLPDRDGKLQAISTAIEVLEQMVDENPMARFPPFGRPPPAYVTPYETPYKTPYETPYKTPYETPYPNKAPGPNQNINTNGKASQTTTSPKATSESSPADGQSALGLDKEAFTSDATDAKGCVKPTRLEEEQADVLLRFAGVCSLSDVDDDNETPDTNHTSNLQPDTDVEAIIEHIYKVLDSRDAIAGTAQGVALRSVISDIGIVKNTIIPHEQSAATAILYKLLSIRAQGSSRLAAGIFATAPGGAFGQYQGNVVPQHHGGAFPHLLKHPGGVHHYHGSIIPPPIDLIPHPGGVFTSPRYPGGYFVPHNSGFFPPPPPPPGTLGDGSRSNPIILPNPVPHPQARHFVPSSMLPPPIPLRIGTARGRTVEEAKKVRDYGFPPLPGSRPGGNPLETKRRLGE